jgi:hypothetical protein
MILAGIILLGVARVIADPVLFVPHVCSVARKECLVWHNAPTDGVTLPKNTPIVFLAPQPGLPIDSSGWKVRIAPCEETTCNFATDDCSTVPTTPSSCTPYPYPVPRMAVAFDNLIVESMFDEYPAVMETVANALELNQPDPGDRPLLCTALLVSSRNVTLRYLSIDVGTCAAQVASVLESISPNTSALLSTTAALFISTDASDSTLHHLEGVGTSAFARFMPPVDEIEINMTGVTLGPDISGADDTYFAHAPSVVAANFYGTVTLDAVYFAGTPIPDRAIVTDPDYFGNWTDRLGSVSARILCTGSTTVVTKNAITHTIVIIILILSIVIFIVLGWALGEILHRHYKQRAAERLSASSHEFHANKLFVDPTPTLPAESVPVATSFESRPPPPALTSRVQARVIVID